MTQPTQGGGNAAQDPPPNTQNGVSAKSKAVIYVLSKPFLSFYARVSYKQRRSKSRTPTCRRRIITPRSGLGTVSVRLVFWKAEIQARTPVPLSGTCQSRRERPVRVLHGGVHTTRTTGSLGFLCMVVSCACGLSVQTRPTHKKHKQVAYTLDHNIHMNIQ